MGMKFWTVSFAGWTARLLLCSCEQVKPYLKMSIQRLQLLINKKTNHGEPSPPRDMQTRLIVGCRAASDVLIISAREDSIVMLRRVMQRAGVLDPKLRS